MYVSCIGYILCIAQKNVPQPKPQLSQQQFTPAQLLAFFIQLLPNPQLCNLPSLQGKRFYKRLFTPLVTLWYLLFQRLNPDHTLDAVVADARGGGADVLNKKLSRKLLSSSTSSYSGARQRVPWQFLAEALAVQGRHITKLSPNTLWRGLVIALLDGSTVRLRPHGDIPRHIPPHRNQHCKRTYWCLMRAAVCFCALSGAALDCAMGSIHVSEQVLACQMILRSVIPSLLIGDRNFGVFRIVQAARHVKQHVLLRMTESRAVKLLGRPLIPGDHALSWKPTCRDRVEPGCSKDPVRGRLLIVRLMRHGFRPQLLVLFTTLCQSTDYPADELVRLYGLRWHIELNLRYLKTQMDLVQLDAGSEEIARKEWLAGLMAYNLIRAAMLCAAVQKNISPLTLSFSSSRRRLENWLRQFGRTRPHACVTWARTLHEINRCRLPRRPKPRPEEPRQQRHLRQSYPPLVGSRAAARQNLHRHFTKS